MNRFLSISLCLIACTQCFGLTAEEIAEKALPGVVQICTYDITGTRTGQGSGFFISPQEIITNEHVVEGAYSAEVLTDEGYYDLITILNAEEDLDLAILRVDTENEVPLDIDTEAQLRPGQRIITIGNPLGLEKTLSDGLISAVRTMDHLQVVQITAPISPGSSGGPLLNEEGQVIGVVCATMSEGQNLNFAIGILTLNQFLAMEKQPEELKVAGSRVLWRFIVKWIVTVIVALIALAFGGGWWLIFIAIMIIVLLWYILSWVCKSTYRLATLPLRRHHHSTDRPVDDSSSPHEQSSAPTHVLKQEFDEDAIDEEEDMEDEQDGYAAPLHCWKCGAVNYFDPDIDEEIFCLDCGSVVPIPPELRNSKSE